MRLPERHSVADSALPLVCNLWRRVEARGDVNAARLAGPVVKAQCAKLLTGFHV